MRSATLLAALAVVLATPRHAAASSGFYVASGDEKRFNDATQVVLMRAGTRTVVSLQNHYQGPPEAFAMIVPVPVVLRQADVKTLPREVFARVEQLGAPRLVEYWEQDPCTPDEPAEAGASASSAGQVATPPVAPAGAPGAQIEAKFAVGEYQVVILSAKDSAGLVAWLAAHQYRLPEGGELLLRPYVERGSKFLVAKVDPTKVVFDAEGRAVLSPLRFHYDSEEFSLPVRLGLPSASGAQDLIVNILAPNQRYEVASYRNVTIPTNLEVVVSVRDRFPAFYAALFDRTIENHPGAVVTEYAWQASSCEPCPGPSLDPTDLATLGADVLGGSPAPSGGELVLTRLHARYGKALPEDLRFRAAGPIAGGREVTQSGQGRLEQGAQPAAVNQFQGRYTIRHPWTGPIRCEHPRRKIWGGPPPEIAQQSGQASAVQAAVGLAFAPRGELQLSGVLVRDVPELGLKAGPAGQARQAGQAGATQPPAAGGSGNSAPSGHAASATERPVASPRTGCGCASSQPGGALGGALVLGLLVAVRRRRPGAD